ncbi:type I-E CRISPR-associated protein Cas6/Cse3/CasE [Streptomyces sp. NPDC050704]|uniref:type I-E CRISPR-associated protein Cas6/Cse3/CasE n=1 Tax=Streptomyces sp. NPDC050704 TaxID=3157219 RepID=UPI00341ACF79
MTITAPPMNQQPVHPGFTAWRSVLLLSESEQQTCRDVHRLHQLALEGFRPPGLDTAVPTLPQRHVLYVASRHPAERETAARRFVAGRPEQLVVQSPVQPNWQHLLDTGRVTQAASSDVAVTYYPGDTVALRVIANPTYRDIQTRKRRVHNSAEACGNWFRRHLERHGVDVAPHHVTVGKDERLTGTDSKGHTSGTGESGNQLHITCREIRATGTIQDPAAFYQALQTGIGHGKAYGCGLLHDPSRHPLE